MMEEDMGVAATPPGHSPKGGARKRSPAKPSVPNAVRPIISAWLMEMSYLIDIGGPFYSQSEPYRRMAIALRDGE